jgi:hypothetical protein
LLEIKGRYILKFKLICCEVFMREVCLAISETPHIVDPEFTPKGAHENPEHLRQVIQEKITAAEKTPGYDAILLGFGLCGNAAAGISAGSVPLVIPRAHDCCTIFLGSKEKFVENFKDNLSAEWSSVGYMERGDGYLRETDTGRLLGLDKSYAELVEKYGEENARYIWDTLHPESDSKEIIFIDIPELSKLGHLQKLQLLAAEQGRTVRVLEGDMRLITLLLSGEWNEREYLIVPPGKMKKPCYDYDTIITA